jgi:uncharacterized protein YkwD
MLFAEFLTRLDATVARMGATVESSGGGVKFERPLPILGLPASRRGISLMRQRSITASRGFAIAVVALLAAVAAVAAPPAQAVTNCTAPSSWGTNRTDLASQVVSLINQYRAGKGLSQLAISAPLTASSEWKSLHMAGYGYFAHDDPAPPISRSAYQRATDCGYRGSSWGENIAWGYSSAQSVVNGWLGSPGHKANIENPGFSSTGVGVAANGSGQLYWTQNFGNDASGGSPAPPAPPAPTAPASTPPASTPPASTPPASTPVASTPPASTPVASTPVASVVTTPASTAPPRDAAASSAAAGSTPVKTAREVGAKPAYVTRSTRRSRIAAAVPFVQMATGLRLTTGSVRCRAEVDGKRLRVVANVFKAKAARCAWRVPRWARGKQLTGVVAVQIDGAAATRLFIRTLE